MNARNEAPEAIAAHASLAGWATLRVPINGIDAVRAQPAPAGKTLPPRFLKNSDEQTVVAVAALLRAIDQNGWKDRSFVDWAVLAAPRFLGRLTVAGIVNRFIADPSFSVSPHVIPNQCLHSLSGTISVGLGIRGPNFGVGGGQGAIGEALLTCLALVHEGRVPGVWFVATAAAPEPIPDTGGKPVNEFDLLAVALAFTPNGKNLRLAFDPNERATDEPALPELAQWLAAPARKPFACRVAGIGTIELE